MSTTMPDEIFKEIQGPIPSKEIFKKIKDAIKTRSYEMLVFHNVDPQDFDDVQRGLQHRTNYLEEYSFRIHWFACDKILKAVIPSRIHESSAMWLFEMISRGLAEGTIPKVWAETMGVLPSPEYDNFIGKYKGSTKEADFTFVPRGGPNYTITKEYPAVVLESGWLQSAEQLARDAALWQQGSGGQVRVVLQVKFIPKPPDRIGVCLSIHRGSPQQTPSVEHYEILPAGGKKDLFITFNEFYAGDCPPGIKPQERVVLDLERLRVIAKGEILARGSVPDE